ncbi:MAG: DUF3068 domain-containing protein, partial [Gemmatimonadetes bacterium]|nr:DUF3068 domain-containing protein [Gemmatimonadota bacterium]
ATYDRTTVIDGLELLVYVIDVANASVWRDSHSKGPESGDARIAYAVEPLTGTVVDERSHIVRRSPDPFGGWKTTFTSDLALTPETVSSNLETARSLRRRLLVTGTWVPWSLVGLGALLSSAGAVAYGLRWAASRAGGASPHRGPAPSRKA